MTRHSASPLPLISVVTRAGAHPAFLPYLIYLFGSQDYPPDRRELIVLDDGGQDRRDLVSDLTQGDAQAANVRYDYADASLTEGGKRNRLHALARGEYIVYLSENLYWPADNLSRLAGQMQALGADLAHCGPVPVWHSALNRIWRHPQHQAEVFCYHRRYLADHCYSDTWQAGEKNDFIDGPVALSGMPGLLQIAGHAQDFAAEFIPPGAEMLPGALEDYVPDPLLQRGYFSLHQAGNSLAIDWTPVDKVVVLARAGGAPQGDALMRTLAGLGLPAHKALCVSLDGGDAQQQLALLQRARREGWRNYLFLHAGVRPILQDKYLSLLNRLLAAAGPAGLRQLLLAAHTGAATAINALPGLVQTHDAGEVAAGFISHESYDALMAQFSAAPGADWRQITRQSRWFATAPSLFYPPDAPALASYFRDPRRAGPREGDTGKTVGFYLETAFHYQIYRPVMDALRQRGVNCELLISDRIDPGLVNDMMLLVGQLGAGAPGYRLLSGLHARGEKYPCLVSPYYTPLIDDAGGVHVRMLYGLAKEQWNHAFWNIFYRRILCYSHYTQRALDINGSAVAVGNPRFDDWHNGGVDVSPVMASLRLAPEKKTLLYAPTFGVLSSIPHWAATLERLGRDYNVVTKLHHATLYRDDERDALSLARRHLRKRAHGDHCSLALLKLADYVITDNSGFIFDAIHASKRTVLLNWKNMDTLLEGNRSFSTPSSLEQKIRTVLPVAENIAQLRYWLSPQSEGEWQRIESALAEIRHTCCDAFMDGKAGERAAQVIIDELASPAADEENSLLYSLRQHVFG